MPYDIVPKPDGREWCSECDGTGYRCHRYGGDTSDSDFSECRACFGFGLKPIPVDEMTEVQLDEIIAARAFGEVYCTFDQKRKFVRRLVEIWKI